MDLGNELYELRQINNLTFEYVTIIDDDFIEIWLHENLNEETDFKFGEYSSSLHTCKLEIIFLNDESAIAFKLRWG